MAGAVPRKRRTGLSRTEIMASIEGVKASGLPVCRVEIDHARRRVDIRTVEDDLSQTAANPWDER